ncbi:MAG: hypothetical protein LBB55_03445, partial [Zoogloeaceae bacterium]|nr:hypothetical protein [Zoogloeaceae bacterium]
MDKPKAQSDNRSLPALAPLFFDVAMFAMLRIGMVGMSDCAFGLSNLQKPTNKKCYILMKKVTLCHFLVSYGR